MIKRCVLLGSVLSVLRCAAQEPECEIVSNSSHVLKIYISHKRNLTGHLVTTATAYKDSDRPGGNFDLEIKHGEINCGGGKYISHIHAVLSETPFGHVQKLLFHRSCGKNAVIVNDRTTAYRRSDSENNGVVLTEHPLKKNVIFEVRLDKVNTKYSYNLGIGITTHSPKDLDIPDHMLSIKSGTWMYYDNRVFNNGNVILSGYGRNIDVNNQFQAGDHIGVLVTDKGVLHFYLNGVDQGPAASNIPHSVYGVVEIRGKSMQVTIIDPLRSSP